MNRKEDQVMTNVNIIIRYHALNCMGGMKYYWTLISVCTKIDNE